MKWLAPWLLVLCSVVTSSVRAAPTDDLSGAKAAFREGKRLYEVGEYRPALKKFKAAYLAYDAPALLYNIGQCHLRLGEKRDALLAYERYLQKVPDAPDRVPVRELISDLERDLAASNATLVDTSQSANAVQKRPLTKQPWFWGAVGGGAAVVVLALGLGLGLGLRGDSYPRFPTPPTSGTINF